MSFAKSAGAKKKQRGRIIHQVSFRHFLSCSTQPFFMFTNFIISAVFVIYTSFSLLILEFLSSQFDAVQVSL